MSKFEAMEEVLTVLARGERPGRLLLMRARRELQNIYPQQLVTPVDVVPDPGLTADDERVLVFTRMIGYLEKLIGNLIQAQALRWVDPGMLDCLLECRSVLRGLGSEPYSLTRLPVIALRSPPNAR